MKLQLTTLVLTAGLCALLSSSTLSAQDQKAVANIPFAYHVGQTTLAAGKYTTQKISPGTFQLRDEQQSMFVSVTPLDTGQNNESKLTFSCYADQCSLSELWVAGNGFRPTARPPVRVGKLAAMISVPLR